MASSSLAVSSGWCPAGASAAAVTVARHCLSKSAKASMPLWETRSSGGAAGCVRRSTAAAARRLITGALYSPSALCSSLSPGSGGA
eukprot:13054022-Alexandrium_andersonii.AAC.3